MDSERKPKLKFELKYRVKKWADYAFLDKEGMFVRTQMFRFHYDDYDKIGYIQEGDKVLSISRTTITIPSFSEGDEFGDYYFKTRDPKYLQLMETHLLRKCERRIRNHIETEMEINNLKDCFELELDFIRDENETT